MKLPFLGPRRIERTGDDRPAASLLGYVWRMSGWHQVAICALALAVAVLGLAPLELQRRIVNRAIGDRDLDLLLGLGAVYLGVVLVQNGLKLALRLYQGWLSESAIRYNRLHLTRLYGARASGQSGDGSGDGRAVSVIGPEIDRLGGFVGEGLSEPVVNGALLLAISGYMVVVEPIVAGLSLLVLAPQAILVPLIQRRINRLIERRVELMRCLSDSVAALGAGDAAEGPDGGSLPLEIQGLYANRIRLFLLKYGLKALVNLTNALGPLAILVVGGWLALQGATTVGVIVAFISGFERMAGPLRALIAYYRVAAQATVQHRMIARWM